MEGRNMEPDMDLEPNPLTPVTPDYNIFTLQALAKSHG